MLHAVIMAGGAGTRFWPASRSARPKQLLNLVDDRTMLQATRDRVEGLVSRENMLVVTNEALVNPVREQLPDLPPAAVIGEPCKRDTAPCIGLAAAIIQRIDPEGSMLVMPADHVIRSVESFHAAIRQAWTAIDAEPDWLFTFGIRPAYPAETFGYIERGAPFSSASVEPLSIPTFTVKMFREKPSAEVAEEYLARGGFYWNSGIFVWRARTILEALGKFAPDMHDQVTAIAESYGSDKFEHALASDFPRIQSTSIDYAVMEKYEHVAVVEASFDWDDVGSWRSLSRQRGTDDNGNTVIGRFLSVDSHGCIIRSSDEHLIVTLGMQDCIVVHTPEATLVARKHDEESIRKVVELLKQKGWDEYL